MTEQEPAVEELSAAACWALLRTTPVGRIAMHGANDEIEIFPINFIVDHGSIVFKTATGTKLSLADQQRSAAFEADGFDFYEGTAWSVVLRGTPKLIKHHQDMIEAFDIEIQTWQVGHKPTYVRLEADVITGRQFTVNPATGTTA
ncbi:MAG: pyridoxamine 5'-phosphate oxidase family protein [Ilumatobacter sp.]|uniref:pyridoxamine 5'-phosphate oxidase family protein n=1 Tax=Ilumatobacter sp. TaxID=1967498 RepID=UPI00391D3694